jgi:hypothetical protein
MNLIMPTIEAHPASGKEVMAMDDIDVDVDVVVCGVSIKFTSVSCATRRAEDPRKLGAGTETTERMS